MAKRKAPATPAPPHKVTRADALNNIAAAINVAAIAIEGVGSAKGQGRTLALPPTPRCWPLYTLEQIGAGHGKV